MRRQIIPNNDVAFVQRRTQSVFRIGLKTPCQADSDRRERENSGQFANGSKTSRTQSSQRCLFIAPSSTATTVIADLRKAQTHVVFTQWPCGTRSIYRTPHNARPYQRVMLLFAPVATKSCDPTRLRRSTPVFQGPNRVASLSTPPAFARRQADLVRWRATVFL
jgi:hypothetical protein